MGLSLQDRVALLPVEERLAWLAAQPEWMVQEMARGEWWWIARPEQVPPPGGWFVCLALAGRGFGKSRSGSEWIVERILQHPYDSRGTPTEWLVIAETLSDARTICMEGPAGILQVLDRRKVKYRYKMSPRPMVLFPSGTKLYTEGADDPDVGRGYNAAGAWLDEICVARGELVQTRRGAVPIETVTTRDQVFTRAGWRPVARAGLTRRAAQVLEIRTASGSVRVTPDHRLWVNGAWCRADQVQVGDTVARCQLNMKHQFRAKRLRTISGPERPGTTTREWAITSVGRGRCSIERSGHRSTAALKMDTRSITSINADGTIASKIWSCSRFPSIEASLRKDVRTKRGLRTRLLRLQAQHSASIGSVENLKQSSAPSAAKSSPVPECEPSFAQPTVEIRMAETVINCNVTSIVKVAEPTDVYDITVEGDAPEFFAGTGQLLVHNCKWKTPRRSWYEGIMPSLRADLIGDHPRAFVTTTPKPLDILQEWVNRGDETVHVIRGSTFDNQNNLSSLVIEELRRRYEGTAIGRQELHGEIIEAFDGALFTRVDIADNRLADVPDNLVATVVGVDPSLTGEDDEMGIVVVSRDRDKHLYIQADRSIMAVGRDAALEAWRVLAEFGADKIVCETTIGKRWMIQVFHDAYYELVGQGLFPAHSKPPIVGIDSKVGKRTRGEPVAMRSEQGRLHLIGHLPKLEDQMATFVSWGMSDSPDRLDAMVHACRFLMDGEKKEARIASPRDALSTTLQSLWQDAGSYNNY